MLGGDTTIAADFADLLDLLGRRWMLRVVWGLRDGGLHFNELRSRAGGLSQSVLVTRLGELLEAGLVHDDNGSYTLTARGAELAERLGALADWAAAGSGSAPDAEPQPELAQEPESELELPAEPDLEPKSTAEPQPEPTAEPEPEFPPEPERPAPRPKPGGQTRPRPRPRPTR